MENNYTKRLCFVRFRIKPLIMTQNCIIFTLCSLLPFQHFLPDDEAAFQQAINCTVTDAATGVALIGVSVVVKGTTLSPTDINGKFNIRHRQGSGYNIPVIHRICHTGNTRNTRSSGYCCPFS